MTFHPVYKTKIWGGNRISQLPNRTDTPELCGESWEISGMAGSESVIANGFLAGNTLAEAIEVYMGDLVGEGVYERFGLDFPLIVKIIDAHDDLSVQVHPGDEMAAELHNSYGKTEMWYIMDAEPGAEIINGFSSDISREQFMDAVHRGTIGNIFNRMQAVPGSLYYIPAGTVHSIGKGCLVAEIQQASDITYRIFDYNRRDINGSLRSLHVDTAADAISYTKAAQPISGISEGRSSINAVDCSYFTSNVLRLCQPVEKDFPEIDSFIIYMCVDGSCAVHCDGCDAVDLRRGSAVLIPACISSACFHPGDTGATLLEVYVKGE